MGSPSKSEAQQIVDGQIETIERDWKDVCEQARPPQAERERLWGHQFPNAFSLEGYRG